MILQRYAQGNAGLHGIHGTIDLRCGLFDCSDQFVIASSILHHDLLHLQSSLDLSRGRLAVMHFQADFPYRRGQLNGRMSCGAGEEELHTKGQRQAQSAGAGQIKSKGCVKGNVEKGAGSGEQQRHGRDWVEGDAQQRTDEASAHPFSFEQQFGL